MGIRGLSSPKMKGMAKYSSPRAAAVLPMMKKFLLYRNIFGSTPGMRKKFGPMGPNLGKGKGGGLVGPPGPNTPDAGIGNIQLMASAHRMGLL